MLDSEKVVRCEPPSGSSALSYPSAEFFRQEGVKVIVGGLSAGVGGMTIGSLLAVRKNISATAPAITTCLKTSAFGTAFFGLRQFFVNPLILANSRNTNRSAHFQGMLATGISGALLGGAVNGFLRGRSVISRSAFTTTLVCCSLQLVFNELALLRTRLVSSQPSAEPELRKTNWWESWIPLTKISDEEWKSRLKAQLQEIESRKDLVDREIVKFEAAIAKHAEGDASVNSSPSMK